MKRLLCLLLAAALTLCCAACSGDEGAPSSGASSSGGGGAPADSEQSGLRLAQEGDPEEEMLETQAAYILDYLLDEYWEDDPTLSIDSIYTKTFLGSYFFRIDYSIVDGQGERVEDSYFIRTTEDRITELDERYEELYIDGKGEVGQSDLDGASDECEFQWILHEDEAGSWIDVDTALALTEQID